MNYHYSKALNHRKLAERYNIKAEENHTKGNKLKAAHFMRLSQNHFKNAEYHNRLIDDSFKGELGSALTFLL